MQTAMIAGLLGVFTVGAPSAPASSVRAGMACPPAKSEAHRPLLKSAAEQAEAGNVAGAARSFVVAFDAMDLADRVGSTGRFAADRSVSSFLDAWRIEGDPATLEEAETFLLRYIDGLEEGRGEGCSVTDRSWADEMLVEVRAQMPEPSPTATVEPTESNDPSGAPGPAPKDCPSAPSIIGVDRAGVALVTVGASLFVSGAAFLVAGLVQGDLSQNPGQGFTIAGGVILGSGVALLIPGAVRLGTWKRRSRSTRLGVAPFAGRGLAGVSIGGRFGARR